MARIKTMELLQQVGENIKAAAEKLEIEKSITKAVSTTDSLQVGDRVRIKKRSSHHLNWRTVDIRFDTRRQRRD